MEVFVNIDTYKSTEDDEQYLSVPEGTDISVLNFAVGEVLDVPINLTGTLSGQ